LGNFRTVVEAKLRIPAQKEGGDANVKGALAQAAALFEPNLIKVELVKGLFLSSQTVVVFPVDAHHEEAFFLKLLLRS